MGLIYLTALLVSLSGMILIDRNWNDNVRPVKVDSRS